jgi:hypothetical protein
MALYGNQSAMGPSAASGAGALTKGPDLEVIQTEVCSDPPPSFHFLSQKQASSPPRRRAGSCADLG